MIIFELQIPDGEKTKFVEIQPWEIEYISGLIPGLDTADEDQFMIVTKDGVKYHPNHITVHKNK